MLQPKKNKGVVKGTPPTRKDSLDLYNHSRKVEKFYIDEEYEEEFTPSSSKKNQLIDNEESYKHYKGYGKKLSYGMFEDDKVSKKEYREVIDTNKYKQRENADNYLNTDAPMQLFDKRIEPKEAKTYISGSDAVRIPSYNSIANKPFDLLTPKEKEQRVAKYGRAGVPDSYQSSIIKKPNTTTGNKVKEQSNKGMVLNETLTPKEKQRPKVQGLNTNITPAGLETDLEPYKDVRNSRKGTRLNPDGTESTHLMTYSSNDKGFEAYPTLFQDPDGTWNEYENGEDGNWGALKQARARKEVKTFSTEKEAKDFANGSWKKSNNIKAPLLKPEPKFNPNQTYNIQEDNVRMNGGVGYGSDRDKPNATAIQAVKAKENAEKYNADIERKYNNSDAKKNPKAQERYKTLRNNVTITPNVPKFAYGGLLDSDPPVKKFTGLKKTKAPKDEVKLPPLRPELLEQLSIEKGKEKEDKNELVTTGQVKLPRSNYYKAFPKAKEQPTFRQDNRTDNIRKRDGDAMDAVHDGNLFLERPLIYTANPDKLLGDIGIKGFDTSEADREKIMMNRYNPNQSSGQRFTNNFKQGLDYVPEATINTAVANAFTKAPGSGKLLENAGRLANEVVNPFAGSGDQLIRLKDAGKRYFNGRLSSNSAKQEAKRLAETSTKGILNEKTEEELKTLIKKEEPKKDPISKFAYGGTIKNNNTMRRLPANKRHIAPMLIGAGISMATGAITNMKAAKEAERAKQEALKQAYNNKFTADAQYMEDYNVNGDMGVEYYAKGGQLSPSSIKGNLDTTGGDLIPLNSNTQVASGNTHGEKTIDGQYGITLNNGQEDIAEIEDKEVIVDDQMVFSERLKYNKGVSYADKAKQIANKAGKLESRLSKTTDKRERNGIERQLAGTNMANRALFADQEATQIKEGKGELAKMDGNKLAYGGTPKLPFSPYLTEEADKLEGISQDIYRNHENPTKTVGNIIPKPSTFSSTPSASLPSATQLNPTGRFNNVPIDDTKDPSFFEDLAPSLIDNVGNALLTATTPKLPRPIGKVAPRMETRLNVNPQLASITNTDNNIADTINSNTNNSVIARSGVAASRLRGRNARLGILAEKENAERGLRNQRNQQVSAVNNANIDTSNQHNMLQFTRKNDIQSRLSGNLADMAEDIKGTTDNRNMATRDEQILMLDLLDDPTGVKAKMMKRNGYFKGSRKFRGLVDQEINRKKQ